MSDELLQDSIRSELLLQRFFDKTISEEESQELLELWNRHPQLESVARDNYYTEQVFHFLRYSREKLDPNLVEVMKKAFKIDWASELPPLGAIADDLARNDLALLESIELWGFDRELINGIDIDQILQPVESSDSVSPTPPLKESTSARKNPAESKPVNSTFLRWALVPCLLLLSIAIYHEINPPPKPAVVPEAVQVEFQPLARVTGMVDPVFREKTPRRKRGELLEAGAIYLQSGILELEYQNGIRAILEGPAHFQLDGLLDAACEFGKISVFVPPEGKGFTVMTPKMTVRDLGTAFYLDVSESGTELHVIKGEVESNWLTNEWRSFKTGRGVRCRENNDVIQIVTNAALFRSREDLRKRERVHRVRIQKDRKRRDQQLQKDPMLLLSITDSWKAGFRDRFSKEPGPWQGRESLVFREQNSRIETVQNSPLASFTLMADLTIDQLNPTINTIFASADLKERHVFWQIGYNGVLRLLVRPESAQSQTVTDVYESPTFLSPGCFGVRFRLATVVDGEKKTVTHYVDGEQVSQARLKRDMKFQFGQACLGNQYHAKQSKVPTHLNGTLDGFYLFNRALAPEEIKYYQGSDDHAGP